VGQPHGELQPGAETGNLPTQAKGGLEWGTRAGSAAGAGSADATAGAAAGAVPSIAANAEANPPTQAKGGLEWGTQAGEQVREIPVDQIEPSPYQPRVRTGKEAFYELAASIEEHGVLQPILVRKVGEGKYQLIAGERRWRATMQAKKATVPAIVREVSNEDAAVMTIIENLQREDLNPMAQARAYDRLWQEFGMTQEVMAGRTGKDRPTVTNYLRLLKLPEETQQALERGELSFGHAKALLTLGDDKLTIGVVTMRILKEGLSVRQTEGVIFGILHPDREQPPQPPARKVDPNVREAEQQMMRALGCHVQIKDSKGKGKITIRYANLEDFDRVVEKLS
jgi:ParB family chromosome partitioning protein